MNAVARVSVIFAAGALLLGACAASRVRTATAPRASTLTPTAAVLDAGPRLVLEDYDVLVARGATEFAGMREVARFEGEPGWTVRAEARDQCFRAVFSASPTLRLRFEDETGAPRGDASEGPLAPPSGPVCARRGESLRLVAKGGSGPARAVVWTSP